MSRFLFYLLPTLLELKSMSLIDANKEASPGAAVLIEKLKSEFNAAMKIFVIGFIFSSLVLFAVIRMFNLLEEYMGLYNERNQMLLSLYLSVAVLSSVALYFSVFYSQKNRNRQRDQTLLVAPPSTGLNVVLDGVARGFSDGFNSHRATLHAKGERVSVPDFNRL